MNKYIHIALAIFLLLMMPVQVFAQGDAAISIPVRLTLDDVLFIVVGLAGIIFGIWQMRSGRPEQIDASIVTRLEQQQRDREMMDRYERLYQSSTVQSKAAFDALIGIVSGISALTPAKSDDSLVRFMRDIQQAGASTELPPADSPALPIDAAKAG